MISPAMFNWSTRSATGIPRTIPSSSSLLQWGFSPIYSKMSGVPYEPIKSNLSLIFVFFMQPPQIYLSLL
jgi:hypothetical protein